MVDASTIVPWWQAISLRAEIGAADGAVDDVRMSLHDAALDPDRTAAYADAEHYAAITHPSGSLLDLMARVAIRLGSNKPATAVWRLDQAMGGGKSHGLVGLWHLATNPQGLANTTLGGQVKELVVSIVDAGTVAEDLNNPVCVVLDCDNTTAASEDFGPARSLGERFLWRLFDTDYDLYKRYREHTSNKDQLRDALREVGRPVLVLIDEVMDYLRVASADDHAAAVKDMAFLRALLDVIHTVANAAVVVVMIASGDDNMALTDEGAALRRELEDLLTRNARTTAVTSGGDFAQIIQRRLFTDPPPPDVLRATADLYAAAMARGGWDTKVFGRLSGDYTKAEVRRRLGRSYPFHPELIDLAENEWSHHAGFQKVRSTIRVFAAAAHEQAARAQAGAWSPLLIGSGDLPVDSQTVREALLDSGLVVDGRTQSNLREVAATDIADPHHSDRGNARSIDAARDPQAGWIAANPHAAQRMATAMFVRSMYHRPAGVRGATEAELHAASFVPDGSYTPGDAESVLQSLEPPDGLASADVIAGHGKSVPRRWLFETRNTLPMLIRSARQGVAPADRDKAITDRAFALAKNSSGPFDRVICAEGEPVPTGGANVAGCLDVLRSADIDNKHQTRLVILDSRWFSLFNGDDSATRESLTAALGLGDDALSVQWAASAVFACAHTASRDQARNLAAEWLACRRVTEMDSVRADDDTLRRAQEQEQETLKQLDKRVRLCYKHIVYLAPKGDHDRKAEFRRVPRDELTSLSGLDVWAELRDASRAARAGEFSAKMLLVNLRETDDGLPLSEIRDGFWNNPHKPLLPGGEADLTNAIYEAVSGGDLELFSTASGVYKVETPGDVTLTSNQIRLRRPQPAEPDGPSEPPETTSAPTTAGTPTSSAAAEQQPQVKVSSNLGSGTTQPSASGAAHWTANININTSINPAVGDDDLVILLRELAAAADSGQITHLTQLSNITLRCDEHTAQQIESLAKQAGVDIVIQPI